MNLRLAVIMDPITSIKIEKDSTFAMLLAAQARGWELWYMELGDIELRDGKPRGRMRALQVRDDPQDWFEYAEPQLRALEEMHIILMRKDPPMNLEYLYCTQLLDMAAAAGVLVANAPAALRDVNEKLYTGWFPQCCAATLVTRDTRQIRDFIEEFQTVIIKPLNGMGGASIFRIQAGDTNTGVILETLTDHGRRLAMVQRYLPEIAQGDKRILMIDGAPVPYALARIPAPGEERGNLAAGGRGEGVDLSERDRWICAQVAPTLREKGLMFVGLDVIGDWLTEINVTSPTCIRELDRQYGLDIAGQFMDSLQAKLHDA